MIVILNYGMGNVGSIHNMFKKIGYQSVISNDPDIIRSAGKIILPGIGTFDEGISRLNESGLSDLIRQQALVARKPILGICLGMQLLGRRSEEGKLEGLGLIPFDNRRFSFPESNNLKIPHMGWDRVSLHGDDPILTGLDNHQRYYFVHSYHAVCDNEANVLMHCDYGYPFTAAVCQDNIYGTQFHPEKSHRFGMALLKNFASRC